MLSWANRFNICCFLDNHNYPSPHRSVECLAGVDLVDHINPPDNRIASLKSFCNRHSDWLFGHVNYDLKNELSNTTSTLTDPIGFPELFFFVPETVLILQNDLLVISSLQRQPSKIFEEICAISEQDFIAQTQSIPEIRSRFRRDEYLSVIEKIKGHILRGDCYELNLCQEFFAENVSIDPVAMYRKLTAISPNPFSCYYRVEENFLLCASPERYLQKKNDRILSQPIKGTYQRNTADISEDEKLKEQLRHSEKDRSENVMVVDLVRNDLSRICRKGSVRVDELFGIYSFPQVHQMISTISGELEPGMELPEILEASFPMGSMTGAPKKKVIELIERYEKTKRGIFSGTVGYISPEKDFDYNVVIRSILYNQASRYLSYLVGGGITFYSDAEKEYEECLLKAKAIQQVLAG